MFWTCLNRIKMCNQEIAINLPNLLKNGKLSYIKGNERVIKSACCLTNCFPTFLVFEVFVIMYMVNLHQLYYFNGYIKWDWNDNLKLQRRKNNKHRSDHNKINKKIFSKHIPSQKSNLYVKQKEISKNLYSHMKIQF